MKNLQTITRHTLITSASLAIGLLSATPAHAALQSRLGGQAYYDTGLNVTWLANANLAATNTFGVSGILADGSMNWTTAKNWIGAMNTANYLGYSDWRLPTVNPVSGTFFNYTFAFSGTTDKGYNISAPGSPYAGSHGSELSYLLYNSLGNLGARDLNGASRGCESNVNVCLASAGPFQNLMPAIYWSGSAYLPVVTNTWYFDMGTGYQDATWEGIQYYALAVRSGDVVAVPEASTYTMMLASLGLVGLAVRRRNQANRTLS
jgi:hypothetical protein